MTSGSPWIGNRPHQYVKPTDRGLTTPVPTVSTAATTVPGSQASLNATRPITSMPYRNSMMSSPYRSSYGAYGGGLGGYGGMYGGGMGSLYGGMGGYGSMYGGGMYGGGMGGMYGNEPPSRGMMALERLSILVNSLCFTAETLEQSMHSMHFFLEASQRIKEWVGTGCNYIILAIRKKLKGFWNLFLFVLGKRNLKEDDVSIRKLFLNVLLLFISIQLGRFLYQELTAPSPVPVLPDVPPEF